MEGCVQLSVPAALLSDKDLVVYIKQEAVRAARGVLKRTVPPTPRDRSLIFQPSASHFIV
jgi:hypothetical protein